MSPRRKFDIGFRPGARDDLKQMRKYDHKAVREAIKKNLTYDPTKETRNRKRLRPNPLAEWELRVDKFRVFYDVDESELRVTIIAVGHKKGNQLIIRGEEFEI